MIQRLKNVQISQFSVSSFGRTKPRQPRNCGFENFSIVAIADSRRVGWWAPFGMWGIFSFLMFLSVGLDAKPAVPETKSETKAVTKTETKKIESKSETKSTKSETKSDPKTEAKPEPKLDGKQVSQEIEFLGMVEVSAVKKNEAQTVSVWTTFPVVGEADPSKLLKSGNHMMKIKGVLVEKNGKVSLKIKKIEPSSEED